MQSPTLNSVAAPTPIREPRAALRAQVPAAVRNAVRVPRSAALRPEEFLDIVAKGRRR